MFGKPKDVQGECYAWLTLGDNYGDGTATLRCQLTPGHEGPHQEQYLSPGAGQVTITWEKDCSFFCSLHGRQDSYAIPSDNPEEEEAPHCEICQMEWLNETEEERGKTLCVAYGLQELHESF